MVLKMSSEVMDNKKEENDKDLAVLLKQQIFYTKLLSICFITLLVIIIGAGIFVLSYVKKVDQALTQVGSLGNQVSEIMNSLDVDKVNGMIEKADTTFNQVDDILDTTGKAVENVGQLLQDVQEVSETVNDMESKVHGMFGK